MQTTRTQVRIPVAIWRDLKAEAKRYGRSANQQLVTWLAEGADAARKNRQGETKR